METKTCSVCKQNKNVDQFKKSRGYLVSPCKSCRATKQRLWGRKNKAKLKSYRKSWYSRNKEQHKKNVRTRLESLKRKLLEIKGTLACPCGESHIACLDFHHRDPNKKEFNIHQGCRWGYSLGRIRKELEKCDVICSNCHRKLHWDLGTSRTRVTRVFKNRTGRPQSGI